MAEPGARWLRKAGLAPDAPRVPICVPYSFRQDADIAASRAGKKSVTSLIYMRKVENRPDWRAPTDQKVARSNRAGRIA